MEQGANSAGTSADDESFGSSRPAGSRPVYGISVAAELAGVDARSLRHYERRGLMHPARTSGGTRRYSHDDVDRSRRITALLDEGLNLAGVEMVLRLETELAELYQVLDRLRGDRPDVDLATGEHTQAGPGRPVAGQRDTRSDEDGRSE
jgi:MerR family transcriptional regulator/heat shock protein HspR